MQSESDPKIILFPTKAAKHIPLLSTSLNLYTCSCANLIIVATLDGRSLWLWLWVLILWQRQNSLVVGLVTKRKKRSRYSCPHRHWVVTQVDKWTWVPMKSSSWCHTEFQPDLAAMPVSRLTHVCQLPHNYSILGSITRYPFEVAHQCSCNSTLFLSLS